jgi:2-dehydro-3-deoxygluconokinase
VVTRVLAVGECMLELRHMTGTDLVLGFAGDAYNTAVYLARTADALGVDVEVGFLGGLGDDYHSELMREAWRQEGIVDRSVTVLGRTPGLYAVRTDGEGERTFAYWRQGSAAAVLMAESNWVDSVEGDLIHLSGITLQLMTPRSREALVNRLQLLRTAGSRVSLDTNYRPSGWLSPQVAAEAITGLAACADVVLATFEDEQALFADPGPQDTARRYRALGATEVVVKVGAGGAFVVQGDDLSHVPAATVLGVVDTTAAGDSFGGAYLAARAAGFSPIAAATTAAAVAAVVVTNPGAIVPREPIRATLLASFTHQHER